MKKILIVDDDKTARQLLMDILTREKYAVVEAVDGREALETLQHQSVDLILTDRAMPGMDGMALLQVLNEHHSAIPVIMISAYGEEKLWGQAVGLGAKEYLLKPFKTEEVLKVVDRHLKGGNSKK
jgi:DNA-binding response OmpR family regulator